MQLPHQPWMNGASEQVMQAIRTAGGEARYVGGCVRDAILGRSGGDVDMACTLPPEQTMAALQQAGIRVIATGLAHGTVTAVCHGSQTNETFEITTLRRDVACDGRHAQVAFTDDWREDAARRDFTMNALYADSNGQLYDYFGGVVDARAGRVRFIGDAGQRIGEDALRILRFFRFFAYYGQWPMDEQALAACTVHAALQGRLSGERIQSEMFKLLAASQAVAVLAVMQQHGVAAAAGLPVNMQGLAVLGHPTCPHEPLLRLAVLLRAQPEPVSATEQLVQRWKLSNDHKRRLRDLMEAELQELALWDEWVQKKAIRRYGAAGFIDRVQVALAEYPDAADQLRPMLLRAQQWPVPVFPVNGNDILMLGLAEGRALGALLQLLEQWWEHQHYEPDKTALLAKAKELAG